MNYNNSTLLINLSSIIDQVSSDKDNLVSNVMISLNKIINKYNSSDVLVVSGDHYVAESFSTEFRQIQELLDNIGVVTLTTNTGKEDNLLRNVASINGNKRTILCSNNNSMHQFVGNTISFYHTDDQVEYNAHNFNDHFNVSPEGSALLFILDEINKKHKLHIGFKTLEKFVLSKDNLDSLVSQLPSEKNRYLKKLNNHISEIMERHNEGFAYEDLNLESIDIARKPANIAMLRQKLTEFNIDRSVFKENRIVSNEQDAVLAFNDIIESKFLMINPVFGKNGIKTISLSPTVDRVYTFDFSEMNDFDQVKFLGIFKPVFEDKSIKKISLDSKELCLNMLKNNIDLNNIVFDPIQASYTTDSAMYSEESGATLESIYEQIMRSPMAKKVSSYDIDNNKTLALINMGDQTVNLFNFCISLKKIMDKREPETSKYYSEYESKLNYILAKMEYDGLGADSEKLESLKNEHQENMIAKVKTIEYLLKRSLSEKDLQAKNIKKLLINELCLIPEQEKNDKTSFLDHLRKSPEKDDPIVSNFISYLSSNQLIIDINKVANHIKNDRIHANFNHTKTKTFRISANDPNVQGFSKNIVREGIKAKSDNYVVSIDYSQFELKILAELSGDPVLINAFRKGIDIHRETASKVFETPYDDVTEKQRKMAKAINFGLIYGKEAYSLASDLGVSQAEAQSKIDLYFQKFPKVKEFLDNLVVDAKKNGCVRTLTGRRISIENITMDKKENWVLVNKAERKAKNAPMQGSAADIIKKAMVKVHELISEKYPLSTMTNQIHDELLFEVPKSDVINFCLDAKKIMENIVELSVPLTVDVEVGHNWWNQKLIDMSKYEKSNESELAH